MSIKYEPIRAFKQNKFSLLKITYLIQSGVGKSKTYYLHKKKKFIFVIYLFYKLQNGK